jgi:hypothetical protein
MSSTLRLDDYPKFIGNHALDGAAISVQKKSRVGTLEIIKICIISVISVPIYQA